MNARMVCLVSAFALLSSTHAAGKKDEGRYLAKPFKGGYYVFGGSIEDKTPPTQKDRKLSLMFTGPLAKDLFEHIGPDAKMACSDASGYRERNRGDLSCTLTRDDGYSCYVGLDVRTGKSMPGSSC